MKLRNLGMMLMVVMLLVMLFKSAEAVMCGTSASVEPVPELLTDEQIEQLAIIAEEQGLGDPVIEPLTEEQIRQLAIIAEEQGLGDPVIEPLTDEQIRLLNEAWEEGEGWEE